MCERNIGSINRSSHHLQALETNGIRLAATVMLIRDTPDGLEVYMVQRPGRGAFPDLHVFPGGKVDESDFAPRACFGLNDETASLDLGVNAGGLRYWVAVARECFEECGVLLVRDSKGLQTSLESGLVDFSDEQMRQRFAIHREDVLGDRLDFADMLGAESLVVACDRLAYFSHWITPEQAPRRFDTRFFLAAMPSDQNTYAYTEETADDQWERPQAALQRHASGEWQMIDPTLRSLETLSQFSTVAEALDGVREGNHLMTLTPELQAQGMQALR